MFKYALAWIPMVLVAIVNGWFREKILSKNLNELQAHQLSTVSFILLFGVYVWILFKIWLPESNTQTFIIGLIWLIMTILFEFLFGHYVAGHSWQRLIEDYNIFKGRIWILVLIWISVAPYVIYQMQK